MPNPNAPEEERESSKVKEEVEAVPIL